MPAPAIATAERPPRVLVLEDQTFFSQLLRLVFASSGYDAEVVRTGQEMLDAVAHRTPDVVVLDIDVPDMDGLQVLERLRLAHRRERLPIMMASARGEQSYAERARALGANLFLKKPYSIDQLVSRVEALLAPPAADAFETLI